MPAWKVLLIGLFALVFLASVGATALAPMTLTGNQRWYWLAGLVPATVVIGGLFALFMQHVGKSMDTKPSWSRR